MGKAAKVPAAGRGGDAGLGPAGGFSAAHPGAWGGGGGAAPTPVPAVLTGCLHRQHGKGPNCHLLRLGLAPEAFAGRTNERTIQQIGQRNQKASLPNRCGVWAAVLLQRHAARHLLAPARELRPPRGSTGAAPVAKPQPGMSGTPGHGPQKQVPSGWRCRNTFVQESACACCRGAPGPVSHLSL